MKKRILLFLFQTTLIIGIDAQKQADSLIRFSDLKYHSDFEREALQNFVKIGSDTFNLFLAIDENMTVAEAEWRRKIYLGILDELEQKKIHNKKINAKIKISYSAVHSRFLKKYNDNEFFPVMFQTGTYNCVSATMLYAMVFDHLNIPFKIKASTKHVYLVANPGPQSIVVETTNPAFQDQIFTGEFKKQYVNHLRTSKLLSEKEYKSKSADEIFEENFKDVKDAEFYSLPGFQYYNKAIARLQNNQTEEAYELSKKAYFFFPDDQVKDLLLTTLVFQIEKSNFSKVSDIDYLAQLSRFENADLDGLVALFNNIIYQQLQYTNKEAFCDSLYIRLVSQLSDNKLIDEVSFTYNIQMSYRYQNSDKVEKYVARALELKGNHHDAGIIMENHLQRKLFGITNSDHLLDTINQLERRYNHEVINPILAEHKLRAYLQKANESFLKKRFTEGNKYLIEFEKHCETPVKNRVLMSLIENTYRTAAVYYVYRGEKSVAKTFVNRGLKYVPGSKFLESAVY
jgi:hypothetical protein